MYNEKGLVKKLDDSDTVKSPINKFKTWLANYFIEKGKYFLTQKAIKTFSEIQYAMHSEFAEVYSDRNRENSIYIVTKKEVKAKAYEKIAEEIEKGNSMDLYLKGFVLPKYSWKERSVRVEVVRQMVAKTGKSPRDINCRDFRKFGIGGLFSSYPYHNSSYLAIKEAGFGLEPWEMKTTPRNFFKSKENRIKVIKWFVKKTKKDYKNINYDDFIDKNLSGLIHCYYNSSPYSALKEAGLANFEPWEMATRVGNKYWRKKENRIRAVKWLVKKLKKDPREITEGDLYDSLRGLTCYSKGIYFTLKEAGRADFEPWEMKTTPCGFFKSKENRIRAVKWLVKKLKKDPREITQEDMYNTCLEGLISKHYNGSPYLALKEARLVSKPSDMKHKPCRTKEKFGGNSNE